MKRVRKRLDDARVNAPLISWKVALSIFGIAYLLLVGQAGILASFLDQSPTLIVVLAHYVAVSYTHLSFPSSYACRGSCLSCTVSVQSFA